MPTITSGWRRARSAGDLVLRWTRRSRAPAADSWGAVEVPLVEEAETYAVDILGGETVRRTLEASAPSVIYAAADQIADWGALLGQGDTLIVRIAQVSPRIGRGVPRTLTLTL